MPKYYFLGKKLLFYKAQVLSMNSENITSLSSYVFKKFVIFSVC